MVPNIDDPYPGKCKKLPWNCTGEVCQVQILHKLEGVF